MKRLIRICLVAAGFVLYWGSPALATTYYVEPGESIQAAIDGASYGDTVEVSAGTYVELITLKNGVALIGAGESTTTIDGNNAGTVVTSSLCDPNSILDGFTITNGGWVVKGGGMYNSVSSPTVINCRFTNNAAEDGGGMYNSASRSTVTNCTFSNNLASWGSGMYNNTNSSLTVVNCTFSGNFALEEGGGMYNLDCNPTVINCTFSGNTADDSYGGGMLNSNNSNTIITNCIFWGNTTIFSGADEIFNYGSAPVISYCDIADSLPGGVWDTSLGTDAGGNIDADPLFVDADGPDNTYGTDDDNLRLSAGSSCLNVGDNGSVPACITTDLDGLYRIINFVVDMGAYENQDITIICVDTNAAGANDGINWFDAFNHLQDGLAAADYGDTILVAEGTYRPDEDTANPAGTGLRTDTFGLMSGVALYGGFPSGGGTWQDRDPILYETILSGDLLENDGPDFANNNENSYHVVTGSGTDPNAALDGFAITAGNADGSYPYNDGSGMFNLGGSPTVINCTFRENLADNFGAGMYNESSSNPKVTNCSFIGNRAKSYSGMCNYFSDTTVTNCLFIGNSANDNGGAMGNSMNSSVVTNCIFSGNSAGYGGAIYNLFSSSPILTNCTFSANSASDGGNAIGCDSRYNPSTVQLINCILSDGGDEIWNNDASTITITYSDVQGGYAGLGNISINPMFKDADGDDDIVGTEDDNLQLAYDSPCIDAGDSNSVPADYADLDKDGDTSEQTPLDLAGHSRFTDDPVTDDTGSGTSPIVDMGVYERYEFCGSEAYPYPRSDANHDCHVNLADFAIMASEWLQYTGPE